MALVAAMRDGPTPTRLARLQELVGVCARTVRRWRWWWQTAFPQTATWMTTRGLLAWPVEENQLPGALLERLPGTLHEKVVALLRLLMPLTCRPLLGARSI